jgi:hypothetical protein
MLYSDYGQQLVALLQQHQLVDEHFPISGCTPAEIESIQVYQQVDYIPVIYAQFLQVAGKGAGMLLMGEDYTFRWQADLKPLALTLAEGDRTLLPEDALMIMGHHGIAFWYVRTGTREDNPPVYLLAEMREGVTLRRVFPSLTTFYQDALDTHLKLRGENEANHDLRFNARPSPDYAAARWHPDG